MMLRSLKWTAAIVLTLAVGLVLFVELSGWNALREPIARRVSAASGRSFAINGDLDVSFSWRPLRARIVANDLVMGNAAGSREAHMAQIRQVEATIDLPKLLGGRLEFPAIALSGPRIVLEVDAAGAANWHLGGGQQTDQAPSFPTIGALRIDQGSLSYRDAAQKTDLALEFKTVERAENADPYRLEIAGKGRFKGLATTIKAEAGALLALRHSAQPYPIRASAQIGTTRARIDGLLLDPLEPKGEELNFTLEGSDLALLFPLIGVPIPPTPAYRLAGFLDHEGEVWTFRNFKGRVGQSDLAGHFTVDRRQQPQRISAELVSKQILMRDLGGFVGADRGTRPARTPPPSDRVLPAETFSLDKLKAANADVHFRGEKVVTGGIPLSQLKVHLVVRDGVLTLAPLNFGVAGGSLLTQIEIDGRAPRIVTHAQIVAKGLHLGQLFPTSRLAGANTGTFGGRAMLEGRGNSIAQMLASSNGEAGLIMDGGTVGELMLRLANLDIANSFVLLLGGDRQLPIHCLVGNFKAVDGDFRVQELVLDTPKVNVVGSGSVSFVDESLELRLVPQSKGFSLASLRGPIAVSGSFKAPRLRPEMAGVIARGGLAVALGAATAGVGALLPLLDFGQDTGSNCGALISRTKAATGVKNSDIAPPAGKR